MRPVSGVKWERPVHLAIAKAVRVGLALGGAVGLMACAEEEAPPETIFCKPNPGACSKRLIEIIDSASSTLQCAAFSFTLPEVADAMVRAADRGVQVWAVIETTQQESDVVAILEDGGVFLRLDGNPQSMHHKFAIVDQRVVATGSFNWTFNGDFRNDENLMVFSSKALAATFSEEFLRIWAEAGE